MYVAYRKAYVQLLMICLKIWKNSGTLWAMGGNIQKCISCCVTVPFFLLVHYRRYEIYRHHTELFQRNRIYYFQLEIVIRSEDAFKLFCWCCRIKRVCLLMTQKRKIIQNPRFHENAL